MATWGYLPVSTNHQKTENQWLTMIKAVSSRSCIEGDRLSSDMQVLPESL
jgi:DNA invertase Pin-like site-specific DNA recombinase